MVYHGKIKKIYRNNSDNANIIDLDSINKSNHLFSYKNNIDNFVIMIYSNLESFNKNRQHNIYCINISFSYNPYSYSSIHLQTIIHYNFLQTVWIVLCLKNAGITVFRFFLHVINVFIRIISNQIKKKCNMW